MIIQINLEIPEMPETHIHEIPITVIFYLVLSN